MIASLKTHTNSKKCSESRIKFLFRPFFALVGQLSPASINGRFSEKFSGHRRLSEQVLESYAASRKPEQTPWKGLLEGFLQLVKDFIEASRNLILDFLYKKTAKNCENHQRSFRKVLFGFL
jgi:hypothetical protein